MAKVLKEKGGMNVLVQATAGESVLIPMVARGEIDLGSANMLEVMEGIETGKLQNDLRIIGSIYTLRIGLFARKDSGMTNMGDLKGKRVPAGYSAMRTLDKNTQAMLATANLTLNDVRPVMVPNVIRGGDDFIAGATDAFMFSFGGPKVREADASVGGVRALEVGTTPGGLAASRKIFPYGYFVELKPSPVFVGVDKPMKAYAMDYVLFTSAKTKDDVVEKIIDTLVKNKAEMVAVAPIMNDFTADGLHKAHAMAYHPGALKYFKAHNLAAKAYQ
jgi:TRAP transporter TAXI family solute receptor